jgi:hypothetical protein
MRIRLNERERVELVLQRFRIYFYEATGLPSASLVCPRQKKRVKELIDDLGVRELDRRLRNFFADKNQWTKENGYPIAYFLKYPDRWIKGFGNEKKATRPRDAGRTARARVESALGVLGPGRT